MSEPTVFLVDDDEAYRESVRELLASVGLPTHCFDSAVDFLRDFDASRPGCVVLDVRMARMSGVSLQAKLKEMDANIPIVFISGHGDIDMAVKAVKDGAVDFVQKPYREQQLLDAINEALRRDALQRQALAAPMALYSDDEEWSQRLAGLSDRERQVMDLALQGLPNKLIARELALSHRTVEHHRSRLLEKLGLSSFTELLRKRQR